MITVYYNWYVLPLCEGAGEAAGPEESSSPAKPAGGVQERPLPAPGTEAASADRGRFLSITMIT